ncbi:MAG TPA: EamA family transporter [Vicinamibacterales bacterium]|nr:EamA family transporter [Vicinamibacterales bacterium]
MLVAFATVYVVWGSTYLAIRIAVEQWPPLWLAAVRFAIAGGGLYTVLRLRGAPAPGWRAWLAATLIGGLMLAGGNGTVCWAEQWVPSGETALILSAGPLWTVLLPWVFRRAKAPRPLVALGVVVGLAGVAVLIGGHGGGGAVGRALLLGRLSLLFASLSWVVGSLIMHRVPLPKSAALATAMEMVMAAPILALAALAHGDLSRFHFAALTPGAWAALAYLVVFGSLAGFGSYIYVLVHAGPTRASTGAFVNPLIAVVLGAAVAGEAMGARTAIAAAMIIAAVAGVILGTARR